MSTEHLDRALIVGRYFEDYSRIWSEHFPNCVRRSHWHVANLLAFEEDGVTFAAIAGEMRSIFGMDQDTCEARIKDLACHGFVVADDGSNIRATSVIRGTSKLTSAFNAHVVDVSAALRKVARELGYSVSEQSVPVAAAELNHCFREFAHRYGAVWIESLGQFLKKSLSKHPAIRAIAQRNLLTYSHWTIFLSAWLHRHPGSQSSAPYLLSDEFHMKLFPALHVGTRPLAVSLVSPLVVSVSVSETPLSVLRRLKSAPLFLRLFCP